MGGGSWPLWVHLLPVLALLVFLACGLGLVLAFINVFFRDVAQILALGLQLLFWLTPVVYPLSILPDYAQRVVLHDLREGGPTDGGTECFDISGENHLGVYIPPGVAHGFAALTDVVMTYLVDGYYNPADELGVKWDDPVIGADWGVTDPILSARDQSNPLRADLPAGRRPYWPMRT